MSLNKLFALLVSLRRVELEEACVASGFSVGTCATWLEALRV